jgi:hypothetical protein
MKNEIDRQGLHTVSKLKKCKRGVRGGGVVTMLHVPVVFPQIFEF